MAKHCLSSREAFLLAQHLVANHQHLNGKTREVIARTAADELGFNVTVSAVKTQQEATGLEWATARPKKAATLADLEARVAAIEAALGLDTPQG